MEKKKGNLWGEIVPLWRGVEPGILLPKTESGSPTLASMIMGFCMELPFEFFSNKIIKFKIFGILNFKTVIFFFPSSSAFDIDWRKFRDWNSSSFLIQVLRRTPKTFQTKNKGFLFE